MFVQCPYDSMVKCNTEIIQFCENCKVYRSLYEKNNDEPKEDNTKKKKISRYRNYNDTFNNIWYCMGINYSSDNSITIYNILNNQGGV